MTIGSIVTVSAAAVAVPIVLAMSTKEFIDVPKSNVHYDNIMHMKELGLIEGNGGKFLPYENITRAQVSVILTRALDVDADAKAIAGKYKDVPASNSYVKPIAAMTKAGIFSGSNGYFHPYKNITREQMASVLVKAFKLDQVGAKTVKLTDKKISSTHRHNVQVLANLGVTKETKDFKAYKSISREQFATMVARAMAASEKAEHQPVFSHDYIPGKTGNYNVYVSDSGVLVNDVRKVTDTSVEREITTIAPDGKASKWSNRSEDWDSNVSYASNGQGKEVLYVYDAEARTLEALDLTFKKLWELKLGKIEQPDGLDEHDGSFKLSTGDKVTIDGKRVKVTDGDPFVKRIGNYEYRIDQNKLTYEKVNVKTNKVVWTKPAFDFIEHGHMSKAESIKAGFIDSEGNAYATVTYPAGGGTYAVAVSNNGKMLWRNDGTVESGGVLGDVIYYSPDPPEEESVGETAILTANKRTGEGIKIYGPVSDHLPPYTAEIRGKSVYIVGTDRAEAVNGKGKTVWLYESPEDRSILSAGFDNKNNFYIQSGSKAGEKKTEGRILVYSEDGKLISKKKFDEKKYSKFIIDPTGKQHYQTKYIKGKNGESRTEVYKYNE